MNIGITGAGGFIGKKLSSYLISKGFNVSEFTSNKRKNDLIYLDLLDEKEIENRFQNLDVLIHSAWLGSDRKSRLIPEIQSKNIAIANNIVKIVKFTNISRIIGIGSQDEFKDGFQPWNDNSEMFPISEYAKAKFESYNIFRNSIENFTWARLFSVYGKDDKRDWILTTALKALQSDVSVSFGECSKPWSLTHVKDVCMALEIILTKNIHGSVNIADLNAPTLRNHLEFLQSLANKQLFSFKPNSVISREVSRSSGNMETHGWKISIDRKEGFLELLK